MADDIVTRLRDCWCSIDYTVRNLVDPACDHNGVREEAADEIERLRELVAEYKNLYLLRSRLGDAL